MLESGGPLPQNVNFGIRSEVLDMALTIAGVDAEQRQETRLKPVEDKDSDLSTAQITALASDAVVQIFCAY